MSRQFQRTLSREKPTALPEICVLQSIGLIGTRFDKYLAHGQAHAKKLGNDHNVVQMYVYAIT